MTELVKTVLILSDALAAPDALISAFVERGFSPITLLPGRSKLPDRAPVAIVVIVEKPSAQMDRLLIGAKARYVGLNIPVLALMQTTPPLQDDKFDSILISPYHPAQIVLRTIGLTRLASMEQEIKLRLQTLEQDFGISHQRPQIQEKDPFNILFIGKASPEFMVIINALQRKNVRVVAAFTSFTAFDYLYEQTFDAVVMNGLVSMDSALSVTQTMRKNAKLYHVPALLLANKITAKEQKAVYSAGMNDIIDASAPLGDISARVLEQANFHRMHSMLKDEFSVLGGEVCVDTSTQLFNKSFFSAHLSRVVKFYDVQNLPVTLCLIRISPDDGFDSDFAIGASFSQIGIMIKNLVRLQDITARIETNVFAIAFPGQAAEQLQPVSERLHSILKCATLSAPDTGEPLNIKLELTMTTLNTNVSQTSAA
ncbi:MAG: diguanylate cyclase [Robiginitomaculum sp.]|nr:diguanylate cyclase [Robiginitomaculum sp.]